MCAGVTAALPEQSARINQKKRKERKFKPCAVTLEKTPEDATKKEKKQLMAHKKEIKKRLLN